MFKESKTGVQQSVVGPLRLQIRDQAGEAALLPLFTTFDTPALSPEQTVQKGYEFLLKLVGDYEASAAEQGYALRVGI